MKTWISLALNPGYACLESSDPRVRARALADMSFNTTLGLGTGSTAKLLGRFGVLEKASALTNSTLTAARSATTSLASAVTAFGEESVASLLGRGMLERAPESELRQKVLANIAVSRAARNTSNFEIHVLVEKVPSLEISTKIDDAVFWSGGNNRTLAANYASVFNKLTLEMTPGGRYLDSLNLFKRYPYSQAIVPWERLSARFANQASGHVSAFVEGSSSTSVFNRIEYPILRENPNITEVIFSPEIRYQNTFRPY